MIAPENWRTAVTATEARLGYRRFICVFSYVKAHDATRNTKKAFQT